jgi:hypothetical protein
MIGPFLIWINSPMTEIIDFTALHRPFKSPRRPTRDVGKKGGFDLAQKHLIESLLKCA